MADNEVSNVGELLEKLKGVSPTLPVRVALSVTCPDGHECDWVHDKMSLVEVNHWTDCLEIRGRLILSDCSEAGPNKG